MVNTTDQGGAPMKQPSEKLLLRAQQFKDKYPPGMLMTRFEMATLAEEIVRECADIARSERRVWNADAPAPQQRIAKAILVRFGLICAHNFIDRVEPDRTGRPSRHWGHRTCTECGLSDVYVYGTDYVQDGSC